VAGSWWLWPLLNASLPCGLGFFHDVGAKLLVEIGPEGGLRHNSPLKHVAHLRRGHGRRPLRRRTELATITSPFARLANSGLPLNHFYFYLYFYYFALGKNKTLRPKVP
jgi:hypothetical protein